MTERTLFEEQITGTVASDDNVPTDHQKRDAILHTALNWLPHYTRLPEEDEVNRSYAEDGMEEFKEVVRTWLRAVGVRVRYLGETK